MPVDVDPFFNWPLIEEGEHSVEEAVTQLVLRVGAMMGAVINVDDDTIPTPAEFDAFRTGGSPNGNWVGHPYSFMIYYLGRWEFSAHPVETDLLGGPVVFDSSAYIHVFDTVSADDRVTAQYSWAFINDVSTTWTLNFRLKQHNHLNMDADGDVTNFTSSAYGMMHCIEQEQTTSGGHYPTFDVNAYYWPGGTLPIWSQTLDARDLALCINVGDNEKHMITTAINLIEFSN